MPFSTNTFTYTGGAQTFTISLALGYLKQSDIKCFVVGELDGGQNQIFRAFTFDSEFVVRLTDALVVNDQVTVQRTVDKETLDVDFETGGDVTPRNLMILAKQSMMSTQEILDGRVAGFDPVRAAVEAKASQDAAAASEAAALVSEGLADADRVTTNADVVLTGVDVILTGADLTATNADRVQTVADAVATGLDATATAADAVATAADRVQTGLDAVATAADVISINGDAIATAADRVQTGLDVISSAASDVSAGLARDEVTGRIGNTSLYDTRTALIAATVPAPVLTAKTAGHTTPGDGGGSLYIRVGSDPTPKEGFQSADLAWWELMPESTGYNVLAFGGPDIVSVTAAFNSLTDGNTLFFPARADYVYETDGVIPSLLSKSNVTIWSDGATITKTRHDTNVQGSTFFKCFHFEQCTDITVSGFNFVGNILSWASGLDNAREHGVLFETCTRPTVRNCVVSGFFTSFFFQGCSDSTASHCLGRDTRTGFSVADCTGNNRIDNCSVYDARYNPEGVTSADKTSGYSFLSDNSVGVHFSNCYSKTAASNCYRFQMTGTAHTDCSAIDCVSYDGGREVIALRNEITGVTILRVRGYNIADTAVWTGGDFLEPYASVINGVLVDGGDDNTIEGCEFFGTTAASYCILVSNPTNRLRIKNNVFRFLGGEGLIFQSAYAHLELEISGNVVEIGVNDNYVCSLGSLSSGARISENDFIGGGADGLLLSAKDTLVTGNRFIRNGRHGMNLIGDRIYADGNHCIEAGQVLAAAAGIKIGADDITLGMNVTADLQSTTTMDYAIWVIAGVTGLVTGTIVARGTVLSHRRDSPLTDDFNHKYGKADLATDAATIISTMQAAGLMSSV